MSAAVIADGTFVLCMHYIIYKILSAQASNMMLACRQRQRLLKQAPRLKSTITR